MNVSGNFGIKKQKLIQSSDISLNYIDDEREVIISFFSNDDNPPVYNFYNYDNQKIGTFTLDSANVHPTNDFLEADDRDSGYYNAEEGYLLSLVRIYWELTPYSASYTTQSYLNGFVKIEFDYNDFASSTYSIVGYYGNGGTPYLNRVTYANTHIHYYDEPNNLVYLTSGHPNLNAKFEIIDAGSPSITQSRGTTANGYTHIIDVDKENLISEIRIAGIDATDNLYHNYRYNWNTDTLVMSATSGNGPTVYKDGSRYIEIDAISSQSSTLIVRLQDFDCNDITILAQEDSILSSTPNRVSSSEIRGGRFFDDTTRFMMSDSTGTYIYTMDQKDITKLITSDDLTFKELYATTNDFGNNSVVVDEDRGYIYISNNGAATVFSGAIIIERYDLDFNFIDQFAPATYNWGYNFMVFRNFANEKKSQFIIPFKIGAGTVQIGILDINFDTFSQSAFVSTATASVTNGGSVFTAFYYDDRLNKVYYSEGLFTAQNLWFKKLDMETAAVDVNYNTTAVAHVGDIIFDPLSESLYGVISYSGSSYSIATFDYKTTTFTNVTYNLPKRGICLSSVNDRVITIYYVNITEDTLSLEIYTNNNSFDLEQSISAPVSAFVSRVKSDDMVHFYAYGVGGSHNGIGRYLLTSKNDRNPVNSDCTYLKEVEYTTLSTIEGEMVIGIDNSDNYLYTMNTIDNDGIALTIRQYVMGATLSLTQSWSPASKIGIRYSTSPIWDQDKRTFWVTTVSGGNLVLNKIQINEITLTASTFLEEISYNFPSGYGSSITKVAYLKEEVNDIIISLSTTDNGLNNVYYVDKDLGTTSTTVDLSYISDSFQLRENLYLSDFNVSYFNTLGYGIAGIPSLNVRYDFNTDTAETLYSNIDRDNYIFETYLSKKLQRVLYKDITDDYLKYSVFDFKNDNEYSIIRSGATVSSSLSHIIKKDGNIASFDTGNGIYQEFKIDNKVFEIASDPCGEEELDVSTISPFIIEMVTNGSNQVSIPIEVDTGIGDFDVNWGDGVVENITTTSTITHTYNQSGIYEIRMYEGISGFDFTSVGFDQIRSIIQFGDIKWKNSFSFRNCSDLVAKYTDAPDFSQHISGNLGYCFAGCVKFNGEMNHWDMSNINNLVGFLSGASSFNQPLNNWDVSNVTSMRVLFFGCDSFNQPLSNWDLSSCTNLQSTFYGATLFNQPLNNWNTSNVADFSNLFRDAITFNQPLDKWDTSNVISMSNTFNNAEAFNQPLNNWNVSKVTNMDNLFINTDSFNQDLDNWDTGSVSSMVNIFFNAISFNGKVNTWDVSNVTNFSSVFRNAFVFNQPLNNWNTASASTFNSMFTSADRFNQNIDSWTTSNVTNMISMFSPTDDYNQPMNSWDVGSVSLFNRMFFNADSFSQSLTNWDMSSADNISLMLGDGVFNGDVSTWDTSNITNMAATFRLSPFNGDVSGWDTSNVINMDSMFLNLVNFNSDISGWTVSSVTNMTSMFAGNVSFSQDIGGWDTSSLEITSGMFFNCESLGTQSLNNWDVSNVTNMAAMFRRANFDGDISSWDTTNVTNMSFMHERLTTNTLFFNQDISSWTVSNVENMSFMFNTNEEFNQDISGWDVGAVTNMDSMFSNADAFDIDISSWDINQITNFSDFLVGAPGFTTSNYDAILIGWESQAPTSGLSIDFGNSKYTSGGTAAAARASLVGTYSWIISDGGIA